MLFPTFLNRIIWLIIAYLLVASSSINTLLFLTMARARHNSCFWPADHIDVSISLLKPPCSDIIAQSRTRFKARIMSSSDALLKGSMLKRMVPGSRSGSWETTLRCDRTSVHGIVEGSTPSIMIWPPRVSIICRRASMVDFLCH